MTHNKDPRIISPETFQHPLLVNLSQMAEKAVGVRLTVEGAKRCRTCHVLMTPRAWRERHLLASIREGASANTPS